jgi:membrane protein DedA with SNARE-associated domain
VTSWAALAGLLVLVVAGGVGFPIPEDMTLVGGGLLARRDNGALWPVIAVGGVGVCAADWILFLAGRRYGTAVMGHPRLARVLAREHLAAVEDLVRRRGAWAVFLARFVLGTRIATFVSAGTFGMALPVFALAEAAGTAIFVSAMVTLGYVFADQAERVVAEVGHAEHWLVLAGLLAIGLCWALRSATGWPTPRA